MALKDTLGPVASTSYKLAARIANGCRAGRAVRTMDELDAPPAILVVAPGNAALPDVMGLLAKAKISWPGKALVLCDSQAYSARFPEFRERGAAVGSLNPIQGFEDHYLVEGDAAALREAKALVRGLDGKAVEVPADKVDLFDAALTLSSSLFTPLMEACRECVRRAGIQQPDAGRLLEALFANSLRTFMRAGPKSWSGPVARNDREAIERQIRELESVKPLMAMYFRQASEYAMQLYRTFPGLVRHMRS